jgi:hypothetical protein
VEGFVEATPSEDNMSYVDSNNEEDGQDITADLTITKISKKTLKNANEMAKIKRDEVCFACFLYHFLLFI